MMYSIWNMFKVGVCLIPLSSFMAGLLCTLCWKYATANSSEMEIPYELDAGDKEVPGWGINIHRRTSEYIDPVRDTTIISGGEICGDPKTEIVIVIESTPESRETRDAIRKSWANLTGPQVKIGFIIGFSMSVYARHALKRESVQYKDIIEESFVEAYYNLTLKGISILKWFVRTCPNAQFLLKTDADTFVDVRLLTLRLASYRNSTGVLRGYLCSNFDRDDRLWSKWYAPKYMYRHDKYPDFLQGSAYYMSRDVAVKLFAAAMATPVFHLEDVYITGLCARKAKVRPRKDHGVQYLFGLPVQYCLSPLIITCNRVPSSELQWVLSERNRLINYSSIENDYHSNSELDTNEDESYTENDSAELSTEIIMNYESQPSANLSLKFISPVKPRSEDVSGATSSLIMKNRNWFGATWFSALFIFHFGIILLH